MTTRKTTENPLRDRLRSASTKTRKTTASKRADVHARLRDLYRSVKIARNMEQVAKEDAKSSSVEAVALLRDNEMSTEESTQTFTLNGKMWVGTIIAPQKSDTWDIEKVVDYLHKENRWEDCSTRAFDQEKWEAEISSGNIPANVAKQFKVPGGPGTAYVKVVAK